MQHSRYAPRVVYINVPQSISIPLSDQDKALRRDIIQSVRELGLACITTQDLHAAVQITMRRRRTVMPHVEIDITSTSKPARLQASKAREKFVSQIADLLTVDIRDGEPHFLVDKTDITDRVRSFHVKDWTLRHVWQKGINHIAAGFLKSVLATAPVAYVATDPPRLTDDPMNPIIGILLPAGLEDDKGRELRLRKKTDAVIRISAGQSCASDLRSVIDRFTNLREQQAKLREKLDNDNIKLEPQFVREAWPGHPLVALLKVEVRRITQHTITVSKSECDPLDLEYQTLFRLTSLPISEVFENGHTLEKYLQSKGAYSYWRNILEIDAAVVAVYKPKRDIVEKVVLEQHRIIRERLQQSRLPLRSITQKQGIFSEKGWKLQKHGGGIAAIKVHDGTIVDRKKVTFRVVDPAYARELHAVLHYIHTPRAKKAFGLYLEDEPLPFSVVAFDDIDRPYKQDLLLMLGYDPLYCLDLARLYSKPGTPFNTSSTIFTLAFTYLREFEPETQAVLSAFMPTYAHGMSMISAGFNFGSLVKEWRHSFAEREIDGEKVWELITKRRKEKEKGPVIDSTWPLLPVFELFVPIRPPRFKPFVEMDGMMVSRDL